MKGYGAGMKTGLIALLVCVPSAAVAALLWWPLALAVAGVMVVCLVAEAVVVKRGR